jgi:hypothetical protein
MMNLFQAGESVGPGDSMRVVTPLDRGRSPGSQRRPAGAGGTLSDARPCTANWANRSINLALQSAPAQIGFGQTALK